MNYSKLDIFKLFGKMEIVEEQSEYVRVSFFKNVKSGEDGYIQISFLPSIFQHYYLDFSKPGEFVKVLIEDEILFLATQDGHIESTVSASRNRMSALKQ